MMELSFTGIKDSTINFLRRFHIVIFAVVVLGGLAIVIFMLNQTIASSSETGDYIPTSSNVSFDQTTIDRVNQLKTRNEAGQQLDLSSGRINPFVE